MSGLAINTIPYRPPLLKLHCASNQEISEGSIPVHWESEHLQMSKGIKCRVYMLNMKCL